MRVPIQLASKPFLRAANEAFGVAKDLVIVTEGVLAWVTGITLHGIPDVYAADVAPDPFADSWDDVVRAPRNLGVSGHTRPAA
jgi:hypothetical protein